MVGRNRNRDFQHYLDRFQKRLDNLNMQLLSMGGNKVLIKVVMQLIPVYAMQCFLMFVELCCKLEGVLSAFWWQNTKTCKGIHWSTWQYLCLAKTDGGLGFYGFASFDVAFLAKQG